MHVKSKGKKYIHTFAKFSSLFTGMQETATAKLSTMHRLQDLMAPR